MLHRTAAPSGVRKFAWSFGVAARLRTQPATAAVPLIAVSGYGSDEDRRRSRVAGFDHHLVKPVDLDELQRLLAAPPAATS